MVALEIHRLSRHKDKPFVKWGCSGLTADSIASRLQRAENGSGDATSDGSLFLDGINHLEPSAQARLLHLLPDGSGAAPPGCHSVRRDFLDDAEPRRRNERAGDSGRSFTTGSTACTCACRPCAIEKKTFLRCWNFSLKKYASLFERPEPKIGESTMNLLLRHSWPGNIRELENVARKIVALGDEHLATHDLAAENGNKAPGHPPEAPKIAPADSTLVPGRSLKGSSSGRVAARRASHDSEPTRAHALEPEEGGARTANQLQSVAL